MKKGKVYTLVLVMGIFSLPGLAQNIAINATGALPNSNAILDISSNDKGILIPRLDSARRNALPNVQGLLVYDTVYRSFWYNNGQGWRDMSPVTGSWLTYGNSGTGSNGFIGTVDNAPFIVKVNNQVAGRIGNGLLDTSFSLTTWGYKAASNTLGAYNTAIGQFALASNTRGEGNTANGNRALWNNKVGNSNTALGNGALWSDTAGCYNTAVGGYSLANSNLGFYNTAVGHGALGGLTYGYYNTAIGFNTGCPSQAVNSTVIGYNAFVNDNNKVRIGNSAVTVIEGQVPFTTPSDGRFKYQVQEDVKGLDFILQLRPVTYQFNVQQFDAQLVNRTAGKESFKVPDAMQAAYNEAAAIRRSGFIAQEVDKAAAVSGYNFSGVIKPKTAQDYYSLSYEAFVVPLVKGMQEQQEEIADLKKQLNELKQLIKKGAKQ